MVVSYLGVRKYDFLNDNDERITGRTLYYGYTAEDVDGIFPNKGTLKPNMEIPAGIKVGDKLNVEFSPQGKIVSIAKT